MRLYSSLTAALISYCDFSGGVIVTYIAFSSLLILVIVAWVHLCFMDYSIGGCEIHYFCCLFLMLLMVSLFWVACICSYFHDMALSFTEVHSSSSSLSTIVAALVLYGYLCSHCGLWLYWLCFGWIISCSCGGPSRQSCCISLSILLGRLGMILPGLSSSSLLVTFGLL
ncbi:unnamed protein product [Ilex paraguariensis]|uniref:NADH dehydrogenase subunit 6 n=1 Tax=Ilex paraguariensis TaxID=185542 RepID=A0ABC8U7V9_9AQUA